MDQRKVQEGRHLPTASRPVRAEATPTVSVVVVRDPANEPAGDGWRAFLETASEHGVQVVIAGAGDSSSAPTGAKVVYVSLPVGSTTAELRRAGMASSDGDVVVLAGDRSLPDRAWLLRVLERRGDHAGGPEPG